MARREEHPHLYRSLEARVTSPIFARLRALLGTSGVDRDARGVARASPDSSDANKAAYQRDDGAKHRAEYIRAA